MPVVTEFEPVAALAFADLVERHKRTVYALAFDLTGSHHDAEDLSQDVFLRAYRGLDRFRGEASVPTWLYRITVNTYLSRKRKKALRFMRLPGDLDERVAPSPPSDRQAAQSVVEEHVERALGTLSPRERTAFVLRHYHDLALREIAETMDVAEGTVKSLLFRGTKKLRTQLAFLRR